MQANSAIGKRKRGRPRKIKPETTNITSIPPGLTIDAIKEMQKKLDDPNNNLGEILLEIRNELQEIRAVLEDVRNNRAQFYMRQGY